MLARRSMRAIPDILAHYAQKYIYVYQQMSFHLLCIADQLLNFYYTYVYNNYYSLMRQLPGTLFTFKRYKTFFFYVYND